MNSRVLVIVNGVPSPYANTEEALCARALAAGMLGRYPVNRSEYDLLRFPPILAGSLMRLQSGLVKKGNQFIHVCRLYKMPVKSRFL